MTTRDHRRIDIIRQLSEMAREGWHKFTWRDWQPLERELGRLTRSYK